MKAHIAYVPLEAADRFGGFIIERQEEYLGVVRARTRDYSTLTLLKLLDQLREGPMRYTGLFARANIRMKKSFMEYLQLCIEYSLIDRKVEGKAVIYTITGKGRTMLGLFASP